MSGTRILPVLLAAAAALAGRAAAVTAGAAPGPGTASRAQIPGGAEVVTIPQGGVPLVAAVAIVRSGASSEPPGSSGVAHMLEHLLFNGTSTRTQERLEADLDALGAVHNAHTGVDETTLFMLGPRDALARMLEIESDMLFRSTFPPETLEKERGIVLNEIARDRTQDEALLGGFLSEVVYAGTPCAAPVTGTEEAIRAMPRDAVVDHWRRWFVPANVTLILMGDLDPGAALDAARTAFGPLPDAGAPPSSSPGCLPAGGAFGAAHARRLGTAARLVVLAAAAPSPRDPAHAAAQLLAGLLEPGLADAANRRLQGGPGRLIRASVSLSSQKGGSILDVAATLDDAVAYDAAARALWTEIDARLASPVDAAALANRKVDERVRLALLEEKPHYFGLDRAPLIACCGWEGVVEASRRVESVRPGDVEAAARALARPDRWALLLAGRDAPERPPPFPLVVEGAPAAAPAGPGAAEAGPPATHVREVLPNGLTLRIRSGRESGVFAAALLVRGRSSLEPPGKEGIADLLHRLAGNATARRDAGALARDLPRIGTRLKVTDDPAIPYDDPDTSPEFSYIRLETLDEFAPEAITLLSEIVREPSFDEESVRRLRDAQAARARQAASRPPERARRLLLGAIFGEDSPLARRPFGTEESLRSITPADLRSHRAVHFAPRNLILAIGTSLPPREVHQMTLEAFGGPRGASAAAAMAPPEPLPPRTLRAASRSPQAYVLAGAYLRPRPGEAPLLAAAGAVLSRRMGSVLREKRGLSYSLGAGVEPLASGLLFTVRMGTTPMQVEEAERGIDEMLAGLASSPPTAEEIAVAVRAEGVRQIMRRLSRSNQAFAACLEELRLESPVPPPWQDLPAAHPAGVAEAARRHLSAGGLTKVILE